MPAITVDDVLVLPRLPQLDAASTKFRPVRRLTTAPSGFEGEGFPVRRAFAGVPPCRNSTSRSNRLWRYSRSRPPNSEN